MSTLIFVTWVFALLLTVAGARKITSPAATGAALHVARLPSDERLVRALGVGEVGLGLAVLLRGGAVATALLAVVYAAFAAFAEHQRRQRAGCGCFGESTTPATPLHVGVNVLVAVVAAVTTGAPTSSVTTLAGDPIPGLMLAVLLVVAASLFFLLLTAAPELTSAMALLRTEEDA